MFRRSLHAAIIALAFVAPLQVWLGDSVGLTVAHHQPTVLAAMEGHYHTYNADGSVNTSWKLLAWPNAKNDGTVWSISIPHVLSLLETHTWGDKVTGMDDFPADVRPPMLVPFYGFRVMVGCGMAMMLLAFWGAWLVWRRKLMGRTSGNIWFLRAVVAAAALPYLGIWVGWWTREVGRQPWIVFNMMRTADGVSHMTVTEEVLWLVGYMGFELTVWAAVWWFLAKLVRQGPDLEAPIPYVDGQSARGRRGVEAGERETPKAEWAASAGGRHA